MEKLQLVVQALENDTTLVLSLPMQELELNKALEVLTGEIEIVDFTNNRNIAINKFDSIVRINELFTELAKMEKEELTIFEVVAEEKGYTVGELECMDAEELNELNSEYAVIWKQNDMGNNALDYAYDVMDYFKSNGIDFTEDKEYFFDYSAYGRDLRIELETEETEEFVYMTDEEFGQMYIDDLGVEDADPDGHYFDYEWYGNHLINGGCIGAENGSYFILR